MTTPPKKKSGWIWPVLIVALLGSAATMDLIVCWVATQHPSFAVEENYYQKAQNWDSTKEQENVNARLGWTVRLALANTDAVPRRGRIDAFITDGEGLPLMDARVQVRAFHFARPRDVLNLTLTPNTPGEYSCDMPLQRRGLWQVDTIVEQGSDKFTGSATVELPR